MADEFNSRGVYVQRSGAREACDACLAEVTDGLSLMLTLPGSAPFGGRHIVGVSIMGPLPAQEPSHRSEFKLPFSPAVKAVVKAVCEGEIGSIITGTLGPGAELCECTVVAAEPGATAQEIHADGEWSAVSPRVFTVFVALHDVLDETMGPTHYCPETHTPSCFPGGQWLPPSHPQAEARTEVWFALRAGDAVLMEQTCWHYGGANSSESRRTLLCISFVACGEGHAKRGRTSKARMRLCDLVAA